MDWPFIQFTGIRNHKRILNRVEVQNRTRTTPWRVVNGAYQLEKTVSHSSPKALLSQSRSPSSQDLNLTQGDVTGSTHCRDTYLQIESSERLDQMMAWRDPCLHMTLQCHPITNRKHSLIKVTELSKTFHEHQFNDPWFVVYLRIIKALGRSAGGGEGRETLIVNSYVIFRTSVRQRAAGNSSHLDQYDVQTLYIWAISSIVFAT